MFGRERPMKEMEKHMSAAADEAKGLFKDIRDRLRKLPQKDIDELVACIPIVVGLLQSAGVLNEKACEIADDLDTNDDGTINIKDIQLPKWLGWCAPFVIKYILRK